MKRLDLFLTENNLCRSRSLAAVLIKNGCVLVNGVCVVKPSYLVPDNAQIQLTDASTAETEFVGRGGKKLKKALRVFSVDLSGAVCMDIGASTGGFTDCMLQNGARKVYAIDVGSGQLAPSLRSNPKVVNLENTNIRLLQPQQAELVDFIGCDVSFISLRYIFPQIHLFLKMSGSAVCLVKPQFEAGKEFIGKNGIVKDPAVHRRVLSDVINQAMNVGLFPCQVDFSPIRGGEGNLEYLLLLRAQRSRECAIDIDKTVSLAHDSLKG